MMKINQRVVDYKTASLGTVKDLQYTNGKISAIGVRFDDAQTTSLNKLNWYQMDAIYHSASNKNLAYLFNNKKELNSYINSLTTIK